jgi:hypothetical protein
MIINQIRRLLTGEEDNRKEVMNKKNNTIFIYTDGRMGIDELDSRGSSLRNFFSRARFIDCLSFSFCSTFDPPFFLYAPVRSNTWVGCHHPFSSGEVWRYGGSTHGSWTLFPSSPSLLPPRTTSLQVDRGKGSTACDEDEIIPGTRQMFSNINSDKLVRF